MRCHADERHIEDPVKSSEAVASSFCVVYTRLRVVEAPCVHALDYSI